MLEHAVPITPLNCGSGARTSSFVTFDPAAHAASTTGSILCADPTDSAFAMRSGSAAPYLDFALFGLRTADEIVLEFEALAGNGSVRSLRLDFRPVSGEGEPVTQVLPPDALTGYFKPFRIPFLVRGELVRGDGLLVTIGFDDLGAELLLRDVVVRVRTSNVKFQLRNRTVALVGKADHLKNITLVQRSPITPALRGSRELLAAGMVRFPDPGTCEFTWPAGTATRGGFAAYLPACRYPQPVHVYYEVCQAVGGTPGTQLRAVGSDLVEWGAEQTAGPDTPAEGTWRSRFHVFDGTPGDNRLLRASVGGALADARMRFRNVHFSLPRFDDVPDDRRPNELDEIFPDLGWTLSP